MPRNSAHLLRTQLLRAEDAVVIYLPRGPNSADRAMYCCVTRDIQITVLPEFLPDRSDADEAQFFWAYTIEIANQGDVTVQLTDRHWKITDAHGRLEEVSGPGVVGEQPVLKPGETFRYTSGCPLSTPSGIMTGTYRMVDENGHVFEATIPVFSLDSPFVPRVLN
jgi:ApaG protein